MSKEPELLPMTRVHQTRKAALAELDDAGYKAYRESPDVYYLTRPNSHRLANIVTLPNGTFTVIAFDAISL